MCLRRQSPARGTSILCSQRDLSNQLLSIFLSKQLLTRLPCSILFFSCRASSCVSFCSVWYAASQSVCSAHIARIHYTLYSAAARHCWIFFSLFIALYGLWKFSIKRTAGCWLMFVFFCVKDSVEAITIKGCWLEAFKTLLLSFSSVEVEVKQFSSP